MSTIWDVYQFLLFLCDKDGRALTPDDATKALSAGQLTLFNQYRESGLLDNVTQTALSPFSVSAPFTTAATGHFTKPTDFAQTGRVVAGGKEYTPILFNELRDAIPSQLYPIEDHPRYQEKGNYIALYPQKAITGTLDYYRNPVSPVIGYTEDSDGNPVYNSGASVQLEFPAAYYLQVITKALPYIGISLSDNDVIALSQQQP